jgi:hypothetical protein
MIDKFFKSPKSMGIVAVLTLVVIVLWVWDEKKNPNKDFYGLLKPKA